MTPPQVRRPWAPWLLILAPAAVMPAAFDPYFFPTMAVLGVALALAVWRPGTGALAPAAWWAVGAVAGATAAVGIVHQQGFMTVTGRWPRYEGLAMIALYAAVMWAGARTIDLRSPRGRTTVTSAMAALAIAVGGVLTLQHLGVVTLGTSVARPGSLLGNATDAALVCALAALWLITHEAFSRTTALLTVPRLGIAAAVLGIALAGSRAVALALLLALAAWALMVTAAHPAARRRAWSGAAWVGGALLACAALLPPLRDRVTGDDAMAGSTVEGRWIMWSDTWRMVSEHPWWGVGVDAYRDAITRYHSTEWALQVGFDNPPDSAHSWPLALLATGGIVLALAAAAAFAAIGWWCWRHLPRPIPMWAVGAIAMVGAYAATAATHMTSLLTLIPLLVVWGAVLRVEPTRPRRVAPRALTVTAAAALVLISIAAVGADILLKDGVDHAAQADSAAAHASFERSQQWRPWDPDLPSHAAHALAVTALAGHGSSSHAVDWATQAIARVDTSHDARRAAAWAAEAAGDLTTALDHWDWLVERSPLDPTHRLGRAIIRASLGDLHGAEADFLTAADYAPDSPAPWQNLAVVYRLMGDSAAEERALTRADELTN